MCLENGRISPEICGWRLSSGVKYQHVADAMCEATRIDVAFVLAKARVTPDNIVSLVQDRNNFLYLLRHTRCLGACCTDHKTLAEDTAVAMACDTLMWALRNQLLVPRIEERENKHMSRMSDIQKDMAGAENWVWSPILPLDLPWKPSADRTLIMKAQLGAMGVPVPGDEGTSMALPLNRNELLDMAERKRLLISLPKGTGKAYIPSWGDPLMLTPLTTSISQVSGNADDMNPWAFYMGEPRDVRIQRSFAMRHLGFRSAESKAVALISAGFEQALCSWTSSDSYGEGDEYYHYTPNDRYFRLIDEYYQAGRPHPGTRMSLSDIELPNVVMSEDEEQMEREAAYLGNCPVALLPSPRMHGNHSTQYSSSLADYSQEDIKDPYGPEGSGCSTNDDERKTINRKTRYGSPPKWMRLFTRRRH